MFCERGRLNLDTGDDCKLDELKEEAWRIMTVERSPAPRETELISDSILGSYLGVNTSSKILNENDRLGIDDLVGSDHRGGLVQCLLDDLDIFALLCQAAALGHFVRRRVGAGEERNFFRDGSLR